MCVMCILLNLRSLRSLKIIIFVMLKPIFVVDIVVDPLKIGSEAAVKDLIQKCARTYSC